MLSEFALVLLLAVEINWPFFVLAARVKHTFLKHWPDANAAQAAMIGGLTGLLIPCVFLFVLLPIDEIANLCAHRGGAASFLMLFFWPVGGLFCYFGLRIGPLVVRAWPKKG